MPDLPTFTVTQATADRVIAAFTGEVDETGQPIAPAVAYKRWLRQTLVSRVTSFEASQGQADLETSLPD